jgi:hypothetical protein
MLASHSHCRKKALLPSKLLILHPHFGPKAANHHIRAQATAAAPPLLAAAVAGYLFGLPPSAVAEYLFGLPPSAAAGYLFGLPPSAAAPCLHPNQEKDPVRVELPWGLLHKGCPVLVLQRWSLWLLLTGYSAWVVQAGVLSRHAHKLASSAGAPCA